ncbi:MAG: hypothetical protein ISR58_02970 [Anaerolineales bacterium]|nr:hypothetical protein [Chloroflexota bacterium]MBL6980133.1 hypothetical protein [Anaerolineales bacterium]
MKRSYWLVILAVLLLASTACNLATRMAQPTEPAAPPVQPQEPEPVNPVEEQPVEPAPTNSPSIQPTNTIPPPTPTTEVNPFAPSGFLTMAGDFSSLTVYDAQGQPVGLIQTPGLNPGGYAGGIVHVAGGAPNGNINVPVIYHAFDDSTKIKQNNNGQISDLITGVEVTYMRGAPGQSAFAYVTTDWINDALVSKVYIRTVQGGGAAPFWERNDPQIYAIIPLAVQAANDEPQGVWYSLMPFGIGGDIVFPPHKGLYYLNLVGGGSENLYLTDDFNPVGISPDLTWVAYAAADNGFVDGENSRLTLYNLYTTVGIDIPINPASNRGAGYAVFSPDNQHVAWMEGAGWLMAEVPDFHSKVVIANIDGVIITGIRDDILAGFTGDPSAYMIQPMGWLDNETLIVEVRGDDWGNTSLVKVRFDGSGIEYLAPGRFAGFIYP